MAGSSSFFLVRLGEFGLSVAALVLLVMIWRMTRIGGFGLLAALRGVHLLQMLVLTVLSPSSPTYWFFYSALNLTLSAVGVFAIWMIYFDLRRIWTPAETPPPPPPAS